MSSKRNITYKCPYCDKRFNKENLVIHVGNKHDEMIPENYSAFRLVFDYVNKKPSGYNGKCIICGNESGWDEEKGKYNRLCSNPACKKKYIQSFEERMIRSKGVKRISSTAEGQAKMLANRKISGEYKFQDGGVRTFTGTYEKKALEFMDKVMNIKSEDVTTPGPIMEYMFEGKKHIYISDIYYAPYNLIIEVKDGGDNPNNRSMPEYRAKQIAKEKWIIKNTDFNYLRLTNNDFSQLLAVFMELKMEMSNDTPDRVIRINEGQYIEESNNELSFKSDKDLLEWMKKNIKYSNYTKLKSHDEVLKSKKGSCHDQVMFEYEELKKLGYSPKGLFVMERDKNNQGGTTHSLVYYKKGNKICWFEHAWEGQEGIGEHDSLNNIKDIIKDMYNNYGWGNLRKYGYLEFKSFSISSHKPGESLQQFIDRCFGESINEDYIEERSIRGDVMLYHGSVDGTYKTIENNSINNGKRFEKSRTSSFWFIKKEYAEMFATAELVQTLPNRNKDELFILIDNDMKALVDEKYKSRVIDWISKNNCYVYSKLMNGKYITGGQGRNFPEYTLEFPVKPDNVSKVSFESKINSIKFVSRSYLVSVIEKYKENKMTYGNNLFGQMIDNILYNSNLDIVQNKRNIKKFNEEYIEESINNKEYNPVYLISMSYKSPLEKPIEIFTGSKYAHSTLVIDNDFDNMYSFNGDSRKSLNMKFGGGFSTEPLSLFKEINPNGIMSVSVVFLKNKDYFKLTSKINNYINKAGRTKYNLLGLINVPISREAITNDNMMFCSQFVDYMFKYIDINLTGKSSSLISPADIATIKDNRVYNIYNGTIKGFDEKKYTALAKKISKQPDTQYIKENCPLISNEYNVYYEDYIEEGFLKSEPDIYYNKKAFDNGDINICFITGLSGSGKSTMGREYKDNGVDAVNMDLLQNPADDWHSISDIKKYSELMYQFYNGPGKKYFVTWNYLVDNNIPGIEYEDKLFPEFIEFAKKYAKLHKDKKFICEGVYFFCMKADGSREPLFKPEQFKDYAFYIKGTSVVKSRWRAILRDSKFDFDSTDPYSDNEDADYKGFRRFINILKLSFKNNWKYYFTDEKCINKFRDYFKNKPETILSESKDASVIEDDFKKKSGKSFKLIDLNTKEALKYVSDKWRNGKECRLAICKEDDKLAGYIYWNKSGTVAPMEVYKDYRGYGLSETLMKEAIKNGGNKLGVYSDNEVAIRLYKKLGFVETGRKKYKDGDEVIIMELKSSLNEAYTKELGKIQKDPEIIDSYGFISSDGIYNENVKIKGFNKWLRGRSELLILDGDKLYLKKDSKKGYSIPGGGWEKDEDHNLSAIRETNEEARIKVKNVNYVSSYVAYFPPKDWVKEKISEENWWYGEYIELYIGEYDGQYKGKVEKIDQDKAMESGKFYDIKSIYNDLIPVHQEALSDIINEASISNYKFLDIKSNKSKALKYLKANSETKSYAEDTIKNYNGELVIYNDIMIGRILVGDKKDKGFITDFSIDEEHRGNRLGSKLIDDAINKYHGIDLLVDKDNDLAIGIYKRRGFVIVKTYKNQYYMKLESKLKEDTIMMNEAMNALLTGYIPGSVDNPNNTYIVNYMQNNVFSGEDPNEGIGISDNPKLTNLVVRDKDGILKKVDESFLDDKTYKVYIIELSKEEISNRLSKYMGESVEKGFIYETLLGKKLYTNDQIQFESKLIPIMDYYESMDTFKEICDNYFFARDKKEESINESTFIPKEVRYFNNSGLMYSDKVYTLEGYINSKPNKILECLDISIKE